MDDELASGEEQNDPGAARESEPRNEMSDERYEIPMEAATA